MKLCSACLLGVYCRYDGMSKPNEKSNRTAEKNDVKVISEEEL
jgi:uncharacterized protein YbbK (DUF523 family)